MTRYCESGNHEAPTTHFRHHRCKDGTLTPESSCQECTNAKRSKTVKQGRDKARGYG